MTGSLIIFSLLFFVFAIDLLLRGHDLPTSKRAIKTIYKIISEYNTSTANFYDLGCGRGTLVIAIKKKLPYLSVYAIDNNAVRLFLARLKAMLYRQKIVFKKMDIEWIDLRNADIVYTYLWYDLMPPLEKKLRKELKKGAMVITNTSNFPNWKPLKAYITYPKKPDFEKLFVYIKV